MTDEQIISIDTAIRHCYEVYLERDDMCKECREEHRQLAKWLEELKESRETINRQKAEIEGLQNELSVLQFKKSDLLRDHKELNIQLESMRSAANSYKMHYEESQAEIERLQKAGKEAVSCFTRMESLYKIKCKELEIAKSEAIKEFAGRLKEKGHGEFKCCTKWVDFDDIDNLVKEMEGGTK